MRVDLVPFGVLKDVLSSSTLELPPGTTVAGLLAFLRKDLAEHPDTARLLGQIAVSVNAEYARADVTLQNGDQVGLLPPVSGGSGEIFNGVTAYLSREAIQVGEIVAAAKQGSDGAVVIFEGIVRNNTRGRETLYLDYEAYEDMAGKMILQLGSQAITRFGVREVSLIHRLGRLQIGETSVLIVVSSAHRAAAYEASRWLIDTLKKTIPIWKKETFVDGSVWPDGDPFPPGFAVNFNEAIDNDRVDSEVASAAPEAAI